MKSAMTIKNDVNAREHGPNWNAWLIRAEQLHGKALADAALLHAESCYRAGWSPVRAINTLR